VQISAPLLAFLEELKEQEYSEEWAYELAYLYHKAGMSEKCIDACDELILWFGDEVRSPQTPDNTLLPHQNSLS